MKKYNYFYYFSLILLILLIIMLLIMSNYNNFDSIYCYLYNVDNDTFHKISTNFYIYSIILFIIIIFFSLICLFISFHYFPYKIKIKSIIFICLILYPIFNIIVMLLVFNLDIKKLVN